MCEAENQPLDKIEHEQNEEETSNKSGSSDNLESDQQNDFTITTSHPLIDLGIVTPNDIDLVCQHITDIILNHGGAATMVTLQYHFNKRKHLFGGENAPIRKLIKNGLDTVINGHPLFIKDAFIQYGWRCNASLNNMVESANTPRNHKIESSETTDSDRKVDEKDIGKRFEDIMIEKIRSFEYGLSIESITKDMRPYKDFPGLFCNLPVEKRVKAVLRARRKDPIYYDPPTQLWMAIERKEWFEQKRRETMAKFLPPALRDLDFPSLTTGQLYNILVERGIF